ncbi:MAG: hypothetical protein M3R17_10210 [Bacteroidota bacterium]|nr:hypothetical protein [Bacteroidota bacterium]
MAELILTEIKLIVLKPKQPLMITVEKNEIWKIESAGIGGTNGTISLLDEYKNNIAVLHSSVNQSRYGSSLPYWITEFKGILSNESQYFGSVSVSIYSFR